MKSGAKNRLITLALVAGATVLFAMVLWLVFPFVWDVIHVGDAIEVTNLVSSCDANNNGIDDYSDFVLGARADAEARPTYDGSYYEGGYPPDNRGACTDLVWRTFKAAGYSLKGMIDADIAADPVSYPSITKPDSNIDFRRVTTLDSFFSAHAEVLTTSLDNPDDWQPGDIVTFDNGAHVGICSDKRDSRGIPLLLHNSGQPNREEDYLGRPFSMAATGHYRFDASKIDANTLVLWND